MAAAELSFSEPSVCEMGDELPARVERSLGQALAAAADVRCTIHAQRQGGRWVARLALDSPGSEGPYKERSFSASTCAELTDVLAVAVVLAIGSGSSKESPALAPRVEPPSPAATLATLESVPSDAPTPAFEPAARGGGSRWGAHAALVVDAGTLPALAPGALLGGSLGWEQLELRLLGTYLFPRAASIEAPNAGSPGAELALVTSSLLACAPRLVHAERLELGACAGAELGWLWGSGTGVSVSREGGGPWSAARAEVGARWSVGPEGLGLDVRLSALLPFERHRFAITDEGGPRRVHQPEAVVGRLSVGMSVELD